MEKLVCGVCGAEMATPRHCGRPMHVEAVDGREMLVCWMGAGCGTQEIPRHCDRPMTISG
jgi:hypothetical protein